MANSSELIFENLLHAALADWPSQIKIAQELLYYDDDPRRPLVPHLGPIELEVDQKHWGTELEIFYTMLHNEIARSMRYALCAFTVVHSRRLRAEPIRLCFEYMLRLMDFDGEEEDSFVYHEAASANRAHYFEINGSRSNEMTREQLASAVPWFREYNFQFVRQSKTSSKYDVSTKIVNDSPSLFENLLQQALLEWPSQLRSDDEPIDGADDEQLLPSLTSVTQALGQRKYEAEQAILFTRLHAQIAHWVQYELRVVSVVNPKEVRHEPLRISFEDSLLDSDFSEFPAADALAARNARDQYFFVNGGEFANKPPARLWSSVP